MRAVLFLFLSCLCASAGGSDTWSIEYNRGLPGKMKGDPAITLYGNRVFSHAFKEPSRVFFRRKIPQAAMVELVYQITEAPGTVWASNPARENVPEAPARIGLILWRNWDGDFGRWFSSQRLDVTPGTHRLVVPVQSWAWKSVFGKIGSQDSQTREKFREAWTGPARVGVVGGGYFHAHGIEVPQGVGTIKILSLRVTP